MPSLIFFFFKIFSLCWLGGLNPRHVSWPHKFLGFMPINDIPIYDGLCPFEFKYFIYTYIYIYKRNGIFVFKA